MARWRLSSKAVFELFCVADTDYACSSRMSDISGVLPGVMKQVSSVAIWLFRRGPVLSDVHQRGVTSTVKRLVYSCASASGPRPSLSLVFERWS